MEVIHVGNVCQALPRGVELLAGRGVMETSRAGDVCVATCPVTTVYNNPRERVLFSPVRDANPFFHLAEAMWMLAGGSRVKFLNEFVGNFGERFAENDGVLHGAYGHRWRSAFGFDQLADAVRLLRENSATRQVVVQMWDATVAHSVPANSEQCEISLGCDDLAGTWNDRPCNTHIYLRLQPATKLHALRQESERTRGPWLDMTVCCRSNDIIWGCLSGDTLIQSPEGDVAIESLARRFQLGLKRHPVYAVDPGTGNMALKWCTRAWKTGTKPVRELVFDDGTSLRLTKDHVLYLKKTRRGVVSHPLTCVVPIEAGGLRVGDRIWAPALFKRNGRKILKRNILHGTGFSNSQKVAVVYEELMHGPVPNGVHVHHVDGDKSNDQSSNLKRLSTSEHMSLHMTERMAAMSVENRAALATTGSHAALEAYRALTHKQRAKKNTSSTAHSSETMRAYWATVPLEERRRRSKLANDAKRYSTNHRIIAIRELPPEPVFDFTVEDFHTALVGNGVLAHNCYGANAVHFSVLQEYLAAAVGAEVGRYYQVSNNFHAYASELERLAGRQKNRGERLSAELDDDRYARGLVQPAPMVRYPDTFLREVSELVEAMCSGDRLRELKIKDEAHNDFLRETFYRMVVAHRLYKNGHMQDALQIAEHIGAGDWRHACIEWLQRRDKNGCTKLEKGL